MHVEPDPQKQDAGNGKRETDNPDPHKREAGNGRRETDNPDPHAAGIQPRGRFRVGANIAQRMLQLSGAVIKMTRTLPKDPAGRHIGLQVIRSVTSAGASYEEARAAESNADFIHKLGISTKELRETIFWLETIMVAELTTKPLDALVQEASELGAMLGASIRTARKRER